MRVLTIHSLGILLCSIFLGLLLTSCQLSKDPSPNQEYLQQIDSLHRLWSFYKYSFIEDGRVVSLDEKRITTSEGQGYAMLRAVWADDRVTFEQVWKWTKKHLMIRGDHLFAWKWKGKVSDKNSATDADTDIALALLLASLRFSMPQYRHEALVILDDIWAKEVIKIGDQYFLTAGDWAPHERAPTIHVAYLAPYAYEIFSKIDHTHPWRKLVKSSYDILEWIYFDKQCALPPEIVFVNKKTGELYLQSPWATLKPQFSYDAFPVFWRVSIDHQWFGRNKTKLRKAMLAFFRLEWEEREKFYDKYTLDGSPRSKYEALPLYVTVQSLSVFEDRWLAESIFSHKLNQLWENALAGKDTPYYLHNWLWFGRALELKAARNYSEFLDFLRPFDYKGFSAHFPWALSLASVILFFLAGLERLRYHNYVKATFIVCGVIICLRYLWWRLFASLNFIETLGPFISISLWVAEFYCFSTVILLLVQVGFNSGNRRKEICSDDFMPFVDIFIPIYSESLDILEKTVAAACAIRYENKRTFVLDDSHQDEVRSLAKRYGIGYIKGPKKHAKAGNLNNALSLTSSDLIVVFDTDHIPVWSFLQETVSFFSDRTVGIVQTPHHFYNPDIFQRAFRTGDRVPNEQDMFNHSIQGGRDNWDGSFFVGSGAVFRREAIESIGGFKLMSITEDIHTSQHLHASGWRSVFVNKDLAIGLTAENFSSYVLQRQRWMLGCLHIFFRNNPLLQKGLSFRHRLGYFASLYYFFFPVARVLFCVTPLYYLLFHLHPILSEISVLLAYLLPYMIILPLLTSRILQGWPRIFWGVTYENAVCFPLFRSMFGLFLPGRLGFKVTPKGIVSDRRTFDITSSAITLIMATVTVGAIIKGITEFYYFGIEKDAYFFNVGWASYNLFFMLVSLLIAWERPQKRTEERMKSRIPFKLTNNDFLLSGETHDVSLSGVSLLTDINTSVPQSATLNLFRTDPITVLVKRIYNDTISAGQCRCGFQFEDIAPDVRKSILLRIFASPKSWEDIHARRTHSNLVMGYYFLRGIICSFSPLLRRKRQEGRKKRFSTTHLILSGKHFSAILRDLSANGMGILIFGRKLPKRREIFTVHHRDHGRVSMRKIYAKKIMPFLWRVGLQVIQENGQQKI